jgi:hypothetical protein
MFPVMCYFLSRAQVLIEVTKESQLSAEEIVERVKKDGVLVMALQNKCVA